MKPSTIEVTFTPCEPFSQQVLSLAGSIPCVVLRLLARCAKCLRPMPVTSSIFIQCLELSLMQL